MNKLPKKRPKNIMTEFNVVLRMRRDSLVPEKFSPNLSKLNVPKSGRTYLKCDAALLRVTGTGMK